MILQTLPVTTSYYVESIGGLRLWLLKHIGYLTPFATLLGTPRGAISASKYWPAPARTPFAQLGTTPDSPSLILVRYKPGFICMAPHFNVG